MATDNLHYVMHAHTETIHLQLDDHWYHIPPNEPFEVNDGPFYVEKLIEHYQPVYGLIPVPYERTRSGLKIDVEAAQAEAKRVLELIEDRLVVGYAQGQLEERVKIGMPVLPPAEGSRVAQIIKKNNINLRRRFNLNPVGVDNLGADHTPDAALIAENARLRLELELAKSSQAKQEDRTAALEQQMAELMEALAPKGKSKSKKEEE